MYSFFVAKKGNSNVYYDSCQAKITRLKGTWIIQKNTIVLLGNMKGTRVAEVVLCGIPQFILLNFTNCK